LTDKAKRTLLQRLKLERFHIEPRALDLSPAIVRSRYAHIFAPLDELLHLLQPCSTGLLDFWLGCSRGHVVLSHLETIYLEGEYTLRTGVIEAVARVRVMDLSHDPEKALGAVAHLLDHLMGSYCEPGGLWLSDGGGIATALADVGRHLIRYADLGYLLPEGVTKSPRDYFALAFARYLLDPKQMNVADPLTYKLLRRSLMSESFWKEVGRGL